MIQHQTAFKKVPLKKRLWATARSPLKTSTLARFPGVPNLGRNDMLGALLYESHVCCFTLNP